MSIGLPEVLLSDRVTGYTRGRPRSTFFRPSVEHGVADSLFPSTIARSQVSKAVNFDMSKDGHLETRGGSQKQTDTAVGTSDAVPNRHVYIKRETDGTLTRVKLLKSGTSMYKYNTSTGVWDSIRTGLASLNRGCFVDFVDSSGNEVVLYCDGTNFLMYDNSSFTDILAKFTAGPGTDCPRYIFVKHNVCFASGDDTNPDVLYWCEPLSPDLNWPTSGYAILEGGVDKITGINELYNYVIVGCLNSVYMLTGRTSATFALVKVNSESGCTSHWSMITHGGYVYWANGTGFQIGKLRAAEDDGMDVEYMSFNMQTTFADIVDGYQDIIQGAYDDEKKQIYWCIKTGSNSHPDKLFIYSTVRSRPAQLPPEFGPDLRYVWAGYYSGLNFNSVSVTEDANGKDELHIVDDAGVDYFMHTEYKDKRAVGVLTGTDVAFEIRTRAETFGGRGVTARVMEWFPTLYQKHNSGYTVQFLVDNTELFPANPVNVKFTGNIPFWNDGGDPLITTEWGSTIWAVKPILNAKINLAKKCYSIIAIIKSDGSNAQEEGTWVGYDMLYQRDPIPQGKAA